ncbi:MAG: stage V sporulation protein AD [Lachnospiraceae bacterium]|nr:stage V sporulation protein AD [Lachnospiraceae bacterium]
MITGKQSISFENPPYIVNYASIVGQKEGEGPLGNCFDVIEEDPMVGSPNWEQAESALQKKAAETALQKAGLKPKDMRYLFSGDLLGQIIASSFGMLDLQIPMFGLYGACSTAGESLSLSAMTVAAGYADYCLAVTSSHFASAEKQFRYPLEYASQRPLSTTWTVTGSGAFIVGKQGKVKITGVTTGKMMDYGVKDSMNMGAAMAPAAADTICAHFKDFGRGPEDYDLIVTGDLGVVGRELLLDLLKQKGFDLTEKHFDCGIAIFDDITQDTHSGGSGCGCSAVTLAGYLLPKLESGELKRIFFMPTGALLSTVSFNEGQSIPGICHGVILEH